MNKIHRLTKYLFISMACNVLLLSLFIYWVIRDRPPIPYYELKPAEKLEQQVPLAIDMSNVHLLRQFRTLSKEQLLAKLTNAQLVEDGYSQRDLALACLIHCQYFDLSRALPENILREKGRKLSYSKKQGGTPLQIIVYPGLTDAHFQRIIAFGNTEKWPLTSRGLHMHVHNCLMNKSLLDQELLDAFCLTPEFLAAEMLFTRSGVNVEKSELVQAIGEGGWELLFKFSEEQRALQDLSPARRQKFLLNYIEAGNKAAAYLMLKTDYSFTLRKLDDRTIVSILDMLIDKTTESEKFSLAQLRSPRSEAVWKAAAQRLYDYAGESPPDTYQHQAALEKFVQKKALLPMTNLPVPAPKKAETISPVKKTAPFKTMKYYIVKEGDSLWKISRLYKVGIEEIKKTNQLNTDFLKPGLTLKIPNA